MTEQHKKRFFEHWITEYCNRLDEVARNKKEAAAKLHQDPLKEMSLSTSPDIDQQSGLQPSTSHSRSAAETAAVKIPLNRSNQ